MNGKPPLFSVLLPTHNRADVIGLAIRSILAQTCGDFELLIVGDGCTDNTADVVTGFGDRRIHWFDFPKAEGFGYANRNRALRQAQGSLIAFAAHDDLMLPDHLERMAALFAQRPATYWAYCRPLWIDDEGTVMPFFVNLTRKQAHDQFMNDFNTIPAGCVVHRREVYDKVGMWPTDVAASGDWVLWRRIIMTYGRGALQFSRTPAHLHFRAHWRNPQDWAPRPLPYLKAISQRKKDWPHQLQLNLSQNGQTPQAQVWDMIQADGAQFCARLRGGVATLEDDIAWEATLDRQFF